MPQKTSVELRQERAECVNTAKYIAKKAKRADRVINDEEIKETTELTTQAKELQGQIEALERAEQAMDDIDKLSPSALPNQKTVEPEITHGLARSGQEDTFTIPAQYRRGGKLRAFKGPNAERDAYISGQWLAATIYKNRAADLWCQRHGVYDMLAQNEGSAGAGGNLVPDPLVNAVVDNRNEFGTFRQNARVIPMTADVHSIPTVSGSISAVFTSESAALTESDKSWGLVTLTAGKCAAITRISSELAEDAVISVADSVAFDLARAIAVKEDEVGWSGDGTASDNSIDGVTKRFTDNTSFAGYVDAASGDDNFGDVIMADLASLVGACPAYALPNAKWYISPAGFNATMVRLAAIAGGNVFQTLADGMTSMSFLGYPVVLQNTFATGVGTDYNNLVMMVFGDLTRAALFGDARGLTIASSSDVYFAQDQIALKATARFDVKIHDIGDATNAGPIVALIGNT